MRALEFREKENKLRLHETRWDSNLLTSWIAKQKVTFLAYVIYHIQTGKTKMSGTEQGELWLLNSQ